MDFRPLRIALLVGVAALLPPSGAGAVIVPPQFVVENAVPNGSFNIPTRIAFLPDGRMLVAEKHGRVWAVENGVRHPTPFWAAEQEVFSAGDCGLLAIAVDPAFATNGYVYFLYAVDPDSNGVDFEGDAFGRLTRYAVNPAAPATVDYTTRTILMGVDWADGPTIGSLSHSTGDLAFGRDGSLLVSIGEGAHFTTVDAGGLDPPMFEPGRASPREDIGAFRAQWIGSLCGKILRIDPATGHGYPSNPFWDGHPRSVESRVWSLGLRNPFRFVRRPGSGSPDPAVGQLGTLYIGDVGWFAWEELDVARTGGLNFGWPCYEGPLPNSGYQQANPAHHGCDSLALGGDRGTLTGPAISIHHSDPNASSPSGHTGNTMIGGCFYTGGIYPPLYQGQYFLADFGRHWIKLVQVDANDNILSVSEFATQADAPVDIRAHPMLGDLFYVSITTGEVRRIRWTGPIGDNLPPIAMAAGAPLAGVAPLTVEFSSAGSYDPDGDPIAISWNFGDGAGSTAANPSHTYTSAGLFQAVLTVTDNANGLARDTVLVNVAGSWQFPSTAVLDDFNRPDGPVGEAWTGDIAGMSVLDQQATTTCCDVIGIWDGGVFGPDQEAYYTFSELQNQSHALILKAQGPSWTDGYLEVRYSASTQRVWLFAYDPAIGYTGLGSIPAVFANGDQFGARAWAIGELQVFHNGAVIGSASTGDWPFAAAGGRIGLMLDGAAPPRIDDFGGGDVVLNSAPIGQILAPADSSFFVTGDVIELNGAGFDGQQGSETLAYEWRGDLHHNNHVHPGHFSATGATASFVADNHEDGTGVWYRVSLRVSDSGGLADTTGVSLFPEINLAAGTVTPIPAYPGTSAPADYHFRLHNRGRMPSPQTRWRLVAGPVLLSEGDVAIPARDSVTLQITVQPMLGAGDHPLRLTVDTLAAVVETDEEDNATTRTLTVVSGSGTVDAPAAGTPRTLALSTARPTPSRGAVAFALDLPAAATVGFAVYDLLGRQVWVGRDRGYEAGRWTLEWEGRTAAGMAAPPGVYLARVEVDGQVFTRRIARLR